MNVEVKWRKLEERVQKSKQPGDTEDFLYTVLTARSTPSCKEEETARYSDRRKWIKLWLDCGQAWKIS